MTVLSLDRVVLAISAFRSDETVIALLERALASGASRFGAVLVVDSLGSGRIGEAIRERGWRVDYFNADTNLGSAGNFDLRLNLAAATGLDWCLALNHDGELELAKASALLECATGADRVGAVYPRMRLTSADNRLDRPRTNFITFGLTQSGECNARSTEVRWSSSNGGLYNLDAIRGGVSAWPDLWMGYEDLAIGWELHRRGWRQLLCARVVVDDNYEFRRLRLLGRIVYLADKPAWYAYYQLRNLALIARGTHGKAVGWVALALRAVISAGLALTADRPFTRLRWLSRGLIDGLRGKSGKWIFP